MQGSAGRLRAARLPMDSRHYRLRLHGLKESQGEIGANRLIGVLQGLTATAARATHLRATGSGRAAKRIPKWIKSTTDFTVTGIASGSTAIGIDAPCLRTTAYNQFSELAQWGEKLDLDDTALDLATEAIHEAATAKSAGNCFDDAVLRAILKLVKVGCSTGVEVELNSIGRKRNGFVLDGQILQEIAEQRNRIPPARAFMMCGHISEIRHTYGHFRLTMNENDILRGQLVDPSSHHELLRSLQGKKATLEGIVSFKSNRDARFVEARYIREHMEQDVLFEEVPKGDSSDAKELIIEAITKARTTKLTDLIGL